MTTKLKTPKEQLHRTLALTGNDLAMEYMNLSGILSISPSPGFFAIAQPKTNEILVFGADRGSVRHVCFEDDFLLSPFNTAQLANLDFRCRDGKVECDLGGELGKIRENTYIEAAMKALILGVNELRQRRKKN